MKKVVFIIVLAVFSLGMIYTSADCDETANRYYYWNKVKQEWVIGAQSSYQYWEGTDTLTIPQFFTDIFDSTFRTSAESLWFETYCTYDSTLLTDWMHLNWIPDDTTYNQISSEVTRNAFTENQKAVSFSPSIYQVWVRLDTTTYSLFAALADSGIIDSIVGASWPPDSLEGAGYGNWRSVDGDSVALAKITVEFALDSSDIANDYEAWFLDSTNVCAEDGNYSHNLYNHWVYEDIVWTTATSGSIDRWWIMNARVPVSAFVRLKIEYYDGLTEFVITHWRVVCIH